MTEPAYPSARRVAAKVVAHFARQVSIAQQQAQQGLAPLPDADAVEAIVDTAFWASLLREEGRDPKISLAYLPSERAGQPMRFEQPISFKAEALARLAPAVVRPGIHLGVWPTGNSGDELSVWGTTRTLPCLCFVLEVVEPGLLVIKYRRGEGFGKFGNVAVLKGNEIKVVDERSARLPDYPEILTSLLSFDPGISLRDSAAVLVQLALSMRAHGRGGALLVVPGDSPSWRDSLVWPIPYLVRPPFSEISELMRQESGEEHQDALQEAIRRAVDAVAGLTAVDGATVISSTFEVLAFGAKIRRSQGSTPVARVIVSEPVEGDTPMIVHPTQIGGTRHLSAAQFVHDQRDSLALVASQEGRFTVFAWSPSQDMVRAHRVEALLL